MNQPLPPNPTREAVAALAGYDYQIWMSIEAWLRLQGDEILYLEGAEDLDRVDAAGATTVQVKRTADAISLNVQLARDAIKNFWATTERATGRVVRFVYLTTSGVAMEQNAAFDGMKGIEAWEKAAYDSQVAELVRAYLLKTLGAEGSLLEFLRAAPVDELRARLFSHFTWQPRQPGVDVVKASVTERLADWCVAENLSRQVAYQLRDALFARCWEQVLKPAVQDRRLDVLLLASTRTEATTVHLAVPLGTAQGLMRVAAQLPALQRQLSPFAILQEEVPPIPDQIVGRPDLVTRLQTHIQRREPVLLSGSVFKGKTTLAAVVAHSAGGNAQWINLAGREAAATADIFKLVTLTLEQAGGSGLVVFDDLNTSAPSRRVYAPALRQLLHRAKLAGKAVLFTAQGQSEALTGEVAGDWGLVILEVPALDADDVQALCVRLGCPPGPVAETYGKLVALQTSGHPKLVQVRVQELAGQGWPEYSLEALLGKSQAVRSAKEAARELFEGAVTPAEAAFIYEVAEFSNPPTRAMVLNLASLPPPLAGASTVLDRLQGRWIEAAAGGRFKVTPILRGEANNVTWTDAQRKALHAKLFDAIKGSMPLSPADAAALMWHAVVAGNAARVTLSAAMILGAKEQAAEALHAHLGWIVHLALEPGQAVALVGRGYPMFRMVQFRTAAQENLEAVPTVIAAWRRDVEDDPSEEAQGHARWMLNLGVLTSQAVLPFQVLLDAAADIFHTSSALDETANQLFKETSASFPEIPADATVFQGLLCMRGGAVRSLEDLKLLFGWIDRQDDAQLLAQFEAIVAWPITRAVGAFVHHAWANEANAEKPRWAEWIAALDEGMSVVARQRMTALGCELARAKSIITSEYMGDFAAAEEALSQATEVFGESVALADQWVNLHYQTKAYAKADQAWQDLIRKFGKGAIEDPFAFRRAAICAGQLGAFKRAADTFEEASTLIESLLPMPTKLGLLGDASYCAWKAGESRRASALLTAAALQLPETARDQSDLKLQHTVVDLNRIATLQLRDGRRRRTEDQPIPYEIGKASGPGTASEEGVREQARAAKIFEGQVATLEAQWADASGPMMDRARALAADADAAVRLQAAQALLARGMVDGFEAEFIDGVTALVAGYEAYGAVKKAPPQDYGLVKSGLLVLGLCCAADPMAALKAWETSPAIAGNGFLLQLTGNLREGFNHTPRVIRELVFEEGAAAFGLRAGAAISLLHHGYGDARVAASVQAHLIPTLVTGLKMTFFDSLDRPLVRRWARQWEAQLVSRQQFGTAASALIPELHALLARAKQGRVSLAEFVSTTGRLVGLDQSRFVALL